jgi:hypothetical protein
LKVVVNNKEGVVVKESNTHWKRSQALCTGIIRKMFWEYLRNWSDPIHQRPQAVKL